ncbi:TetR/AcrR family transcriptional regulator [Paenibacillus nicotianae]|uniref:TetR/AcrR family transcriptional regulator n=1 Tax=Paenibacillus nicotianae TaxID=1526551 RepID=A0ABW4UQ67_9BACL
MQIALKQFVDAGYHATKVSDIVAEAGVAQGTFYWYFKSKESIALEIIEQGRQQLLEVIGVGYRTHSGTADDMVQASEKLLYRLFQFAEQHTHLMRMLLDGTGFSEAVREQIMLTRSHMEQGFVQNIQRAIELEMLPVHTEASVRAAFLMSLIEGVIVRWLFNSGTSTSSSGLANRSAEQLAKETARFEFYGLLGRTD